MTLHDITQGGVPGWTIHIGVGFMMFYISLIHTVAYTSCTFPPCSLHLLSLIMKAEVSMAPRLSTADPSFQYKLVTPTVKAILSQPKLTNGAQQFINQRHFTFTYQYSWRSRKALKREWSPPFLVFWTWWHTPFFRSFSYRGRMFAKVSCNGLSCIFPPGVATSPMVFAYGVVSGFFLCTVVLGVNSRLALFDCSHDV